MGEGKTYLTGKMGEKLTIRIMDEEGNYITVEGKVTGYGSS